MSEVLPSEQSSGLRSMSTGIATGTCGLPQALSVSGRWQSSSRPTEPTLYNLGEYRCISVYYLQYSSALVGSMFICKNNVICAPRFKTIKTCKPSGTTLKVQTYIQVVRLPSLHTYIYVSNATQPSKYVSTNYPQLVLLLHLHAVISIF